MRRRFVGGIAVVMLGVVVAAGCSSDDDGDTSPTDPSTSMTAAPDTEPPASSSTSPTSPPPTPPPTSVTTLAPTTTLDPAAQADADVRAALTAVDESWSTCLRQLPACDVSLLAETRVNPQLQFSSDLATRWNSEGNMARDIERARYSIQTITFNETMNEAVVRTCFEDPIVIYRPNAGPAGEEVIVSDAFVSGITDWMMAKGEDGRWRVFDNEAVEALGTGELVCEVTG